MSRLQWKFLQVENQIFVTSNRAWEGIEAILFHQLKLWILTVDSELDLLCAGLGPEPVIRAAAVVAGVVARGLGELQHRRAASRLLHSCASRQLPVTPAPAQLRAGLPQKYL